MRRESPGGEEERVLGICPGICCYVYKNGHESALDIVVLVSAIIERRRIIEAEGTRRRGEEIENENEDFRSEWEDGWMGEMEWSL